LKRSSRRDHTGDHSISADRSNGSGVGVPSISVGAWSPRYCASLNSRTSLGTMASPDGKSANRRSPDLVALINPGIALDRLHERAGFTLFGGAALAEAAPLSPARSSSIDSAGAEKLCPA